ncbi:MAG TPA: AAA family ATPase, partial [Microbacteriaceae bacterium]|nr:AAA family ATPase [Microbacteriaceae bacterium]
MYLKSLTLRGFKSFAQPTTFEFEPGVTAVVGPNGSGKSNVVDALAWVMGEQGAKTLRGGKMEDVIFAGTSSRGPLGRAEVKLTIDNSDGALPIDYSEVTISRTLFRNGASEYAINGEGCRLLDVQELLSDSGLGNQMHVIVGQGQLDTVLRATAEDRRAFIEEAAGILKHRKRKERTLRKLDAMEANLTRLSDLAGEVRRQLKPLGRQAEVAKKAQFIAAEVRDAKARILADDVHRLRLEIEDLTRDDSARHTEKIVLSEQHEQKQLRIKNIESAQQSDAVDQARRVSLDLERAQGKLRGLYEQVQQRLTFLATQSEGLPTPNLLSEQHLIDAQNELEQLKNKLPEAENAWQQTVQKTQKAQIQLDALDEHIASQSALLAQHDLELSKLRGKIDTAKQTVNTILHEQERRRIAKQDAVKRLEEAEQSLTEFERLNKNIQEADPALEEAHKAVGDKLTEVRKKIDEARDLLHSSERERAGLEAKMAALTSALDLGGGSKQLATETLGVVAEHVRAEAGYETAVDAALGSLAEAFLVKTRKDAIRIINRAKEESLGRVSLLIADVSEANGTPLQLDTKLEAQNDALKSENLTRITDVIHAPEGVKAVLQHSYIAANLKDAIRSAETLQTVLEKTSFTVVTISGEKISRNLLRGGEGSAPSKIELLAERDRAEANLVELETTIGELHKNHETLKQQAASLKKEEELSLTELRRADAERANKQKEHNRLNAHKDAFKAELERILESEQHVNKSLATAKQQQDDAERALAEESSKPKPIFDPSEREDVHAEVEQLRAIEVRARIDLETARERVRAQKEQTGALEKQLQAQRQAADEAARREVLRARQVTEAKRIATLLPTVIDACDRSLNEARMLQHEAEAERAKSNQELVLLRSEEAEIRSRLAKLTETSHTVELKTYERKLSLSALLERAGDELGLVEDVLLAEYGPDVPIELHDPELHEPQLLDASADDESARSS